VTYCWEATEVHPRFGLQHIVSEQGGTPSGYNAGQLETGTWAYEPQTKTITMQFDNYPGVVSTGQKRRGNFSGTIIAPNPAGIWEGCFIS